MFMHCIKVLMHPGSFRTVRNVLLRNVTSLIPTLELCLDGLINIFCGHVIGSVEEADLVGEC